MLGYGQPWVQATGLTFRTVFWEYTTAKAACVWANGLTFRTVYTTAKIILQMKTVTTAELIT